MRSISTKRSAWRDLAKRNRLICPCNNNSRRFVYNISLRLAVILLENALFSVRLPKFYQNFSEKNKKTDRQLSYLICYNDGVRIN